MVSLLSPPGFVLSLLNYHIVTLRAAGSEGTFLGKVSRFLRKKIKDEEEVTIETLVISRPAANRQASRACSSTTQPARSPSSPSPGNTRKKRE